MSKLLLLSLVLLSPHLKADNRLLYLEIQGIGGYSGQKGAWVSFSHHRHAAMQHPSLGFDYLQRLTGRRGDWGALAIQFRLNFVSESGFSVEPQLFNLYLKVKNSWGDLWLGHNRPAFGLNALLDTHGQLIQTLAMEGMGYERDWGLGYARDLPWGSVAASLTTGTGMSLRLNQSPLLSARLSFGVLERDNLTLGLSFSNGTSPSHPDTMESSRSNGWTAGSIDLSHRLNRLENRLELILGRSLDHPLLALNWLGTMRLDGEERWALQSQAAWWRRGGMDGSRIGIGLSWQAQSDLALRTFAYYDKTSRSASLIFQIYYYRPIWF